MLLQYRDVTIQPELLSWDHTSVVPPHQMLQQGFVCGTAHKTCFPLWNVLVSEVERAVDKNAPVSLVWRGSGKNLESYRGKPGGKNMIWGAFLGKDFLFEHKWLFTVDFLVLATFFSVKQLTFPLRLFILTHDLIKFIKISKCDLSLTSHACIWRNKWKYAKNHQELWKFCVFSVTWPHIISNKQIEKDTQREKSLDQGGHEGLHTAEVRHTGLTRTASESFYKLGTFSPNFLHNAKDVYGGKWC